MEFNIDPRIMVAISGQESAFDTARERSGKLFPCEVSNNPFGLGHPCRSYSSLIQATGDDACALHYNYINDHYRRWTPTGLLMGGYCDLSSDPKCIGWDQGVGEFYYNELGATRDDDQTDPGICDFGDCNDDGQVTITDLIAMFDLSLSGTITAMAGLDVAVGQEMADSTCLNGLDPKTGQVDINDLIHAVGVALDGPPPPPPPPPTPMPLAQRPLSQYEEDDPSDARNTSTPTPELETPTPDETPDVCESCTCEDCRNGGCFDDDGYMCPECASCPPLTDTPEPTPTPGKPCQLALSATEINNYDTETFEFAIHPPIAQTAGGIVLDVLANGVLQACDFEPQLPAGESDILTGSFEVDVPCPFQQDPTPVQVGFLVLSPSGSRLCSDAVEIAVFDDGSCDFSAAAAQSTSSRVLFGGFSHKSSTR